MLGFILFVYINPILFPFIFKYLFIFYSNILTKLFLEFYNKIVITIFRQKVIKYNFNFLVLPMGCNKIPFTGIEVFEL